ncbi:uncharacterized protein LOC124533117 [Vanessa cardui]|nr:uncharacterized protein LOC124533117 [Vanessa cardui]
MQEITEDNNCHKDNMDNSIILEIVEDNDTQKENNWNKWHPKTLKRRVSNVLKTNTATKASVTSKLDKLSEVRLELVQLQMETARKEMKFKEEEHKLKMQHLHNDEKRKQEIHALLLQKLNHASAPSQIFDNI